MIVNSNRQHALGVVLADHITVENSLDLMWGGHAIARLHEGILVLLADDIHAQLDALIADEHCRSGDQLAYLVLALAAEGAIEGVFFLLCHSILSPSCGDGLDYHRPITFFQDHAEFYRRIRKTLSRPEHARGAVIKIGLTDP